jgi:hypothetical protein
MSASEPSIEPTLPLTGKKVYSAAVIAAYTALANIPVGCILYGLNLQARGSRSLGRLIFVVGIAGAAGLALAVLFAPSSSRLLTFVSIFAAFCFYRFEKAPVASALREASLARWWPPALWVAGAIGLLVGIAFLLP